MKTVLIWRSIHQLDKALSSNSDVVAKSDGKSQARLQAREEREKEELLAKASHIDS